MQEEQERLRIEKEAQGGYTQSGFLQVSRNGDALDTENDGFVSIDPPKAALDQEKATTITAANMNIKTVEQGRQLSKTVQMGDVKLKNRLKQQKQLHQQIVSAK